MSIDEKSCGALLFRRGEQQIEFLVVKYRVGVDYWGLVKGHVEAGEDEHGTARREIYEEVGLRVDEFVDGFRAESVYQPRPGVTKLVVFFLAEAPPDPIRLLAGEQTDYQWLPFQAAAARLTHAQDRRVMANAVAFLANTLR